MRVQRVIFAWTFIFGTLQNVGAPAEDAAKQDPGNQPAIVLSQCRIKLIDRVTLASDRSGILAFVEPREGDPVEKGAAIAGLRDQVPRAALAVAEHTATNDVEVRFAKKSSEVAWAEYHKAIETNKRATKAVPEVEILRLKLAAERSDLQSEQAAHEFQKSMLTRDQARAELGAYRIEAPINGVVTRLYKFAGEAVQQGDPIAEIVNPNRLRVEGFIDVRDVRAVAANQPVNVQLEIPGERPTLSPEVLEGRVIFVDVSVQPVTHKVRVWAEVVNRDVVLRAGLTARMVIRTEETPRAARGG